MERLRPRMNLPFQGTRKGHSFGCAPKFQLASPADSRLFAFAVTDRAQPHLFDYSDDEEGLQALANLIRSEEVLAVVRGQLAPFEVVSLVEVAMGGRIHADRLSIPRGL